MEAWNGPLAALGSRLERDLPPEHAQLIRSFADDLLARGRSVARARSVGNHLKRWAALLGNAFPDPSRQEVADAVEAMAREPLAPSTLELRKGTLRQFYKWHLGDGETYPECVQGIQPDRRRMAAAPSPEPLAWEDLRRLMDAARTARDKALVSLLWDVGGRIGEILSLRVGDVGFDAKGGYVQVTEDGSGSRRLRLLHALPAVYAWLEVHPRREDPRAPLFVSRTEDGHGPMQYPNAWATVRRLGERAGLERKVHPRLFRESRARDLVARGVPQRLLEDRLHPSGSDDGDGSLAPPAAPEGVDPGDAVRACPRCRWPYREAANYCARCGVALTQQAAFLWEGQEWASRETGRSLALLLTALARSPAGLRLLTRVVEGVADPTLPAERPSSDDREGGA